MTERPPPDTHDVRLVASGTGDPPEMGGQITHGGTAGRNVRRCYLTGLERAALVSAVEMGGFLSRPPPPRIVDAGLIAEVAAPRWSITSLGVDALNRGWWLT